MVTMMAAPLASCPRDGCGGTLLLESDHIDETPSWRCTLCAREVGQIELSVLPLLRRREPSHGKKPLW